jgi:coenzyme F420-0:L-glutamate ligase/coenzyme F420-1:gamma-L-glutamate ligase
VTLEIIPVGGLPEIAPEADLGALVADAARASAAGLRSGDVLVVTQKIVS